jgi:ribosomal protein S7
VAFEDQYRAYREVIAAAIQVLRPQLEVTTTGLDGLEAEVARRNPRVVISSQNRPASLRPGGTWVQVPLEVGPRTQVTLENLLEVIDGVDNPSSPGALKAKQGR